MPLQEDILRDLISRVDALYSPLSKARQVAYGLVEQCRTRPRWLIPSTQQVDDEARLDSIDRCLVELSSFLPLRDLIAYVRRHNKFYDAIASAAAKSAHNPSLSVAEHQVVARLEQTAREASMIRGRIYHLEGRRFGLPVAGLYTALANKQALLEQIVDSMELVAIDIRDAAALASLLKKVNEAAEAGERLLRETLLAARAGEAAESLLQRFWGPVHFDQVVELNIPHLGEDDQRLIGEWPGKSPYEIKRKESARCAEIVALRLYAYLHGQAEDLSILQVRKPDDDRWTLADIEAAGRLYDVKNARRSFSSPNSYSRERVREFKRDGRGNDVVISGFLSPYFADGSRYDDEPNSVIWMGELQARTITELKMAIQAESLELQLRFDSAFTRASLIPPWMFEYPDVCYQERDERIHGTRAETFVWPRAGASMSTLVRCGEHAQLLDHPESREALALARRIDQMGRPSRPLLFLHVLERFCQAVVRREPCPLESLRDLLFPTEGARSRNLAAPLGLNDPLQTISSLLHVLKVMWECSQEHLLQFKGFRLTGPAILKGILPDGSDQTIYAYCGGWILECTLWSDAAESEAWESAPERSEWFCNAQPSDEWYEGIDESAADEGALPDEWFIRDAFVQSDDDEFMPLDEGLGDCLDSGNLELPDSWPAEVPESRFRKSGSKPCGQEPLVLGLNSACSCCCKLVCHVCGFCSETCPRCAEQQVAHSRRLSLYDNNEASSDRLRFAHLVADKALGRRLEQAHQRRDRFMRVLQRAPEEMWEWTLFLVEKLARRRTL